MSNLTSRRRPKLTDCIAVSRPRHRAANSRANRRYCVKLPEPVQWFAHVFFTETYSQLRVACRFQVWCSLIAFERASRRVASRRVDALVLRSATLISSRETIVLPAFEKTIRNARKRCSVTVTSNESQGQFGRRAPQTQLRSLHLLWNTRSTDSEEYEYSVMYEYSTPWRDTEAIRES